jgi:hypothetical protein
MLRNFQQREHSPMQPDAILAVQHRTARIELGQARNQQQL